MKAIIVDKNGIETEIKGSTIKFELEKNKIIEVDLEPHPHFTDALNLTSKSGGSELFSTFAIKAGAANVLHLYVDLHEPRTDD